MIFVVNTSILRQAGPAGSVAKYWFFSVNANGLLQVDAACDGFASIAANALLQVDAASDYSAPISSCRGGMGEAQGDPPRHCGLAPEGATAAERQC